MHKIYFIICLMVLSQAYLIGQNTVKGTIKDANGEPLPFATVLVQGTDQGTSADLDGNYELTFTGDEQSVFIFSYTGYKEKSVVYNNQSVINVNLEVVSALIEEVIVVGYGTQEKSDLVSSVAVIDVEEAQMVPTTNVAEMLRGKTAGVQVTLADARPGGNSNILIRGRNSFVGGNEPLFIVDGVPADNINGINVEDVKSIEVLKDASAQSIYGARASNGVVLVTTKRGSAGTIKASYHGYYGEQRLVRNFDLYNGEEWAQLARESYRTDNMNDEYELETFVFTPLQLDVLESGEYVDWEEEVMRTTSQQSHALSLSGGSQNTSLFASFGFFKQNGLVPGSGYQRGTARLNIDQKVSDRVKFGANIYMLTDRQDVETDRYLSFITLTPLARVRDENGELIRFPTGDAVLANPLWDLRESNRDLRTNEFNFTVFGEIEIFKNLKYKLNAYLSRRNRNGGSYQTSLHSGAFNVSGRGVLFSDARDEYLIENIVTYESDFADEKHHFDVTLLQSANERNYNNSTTQATDFPNDLLGYNGIASASTILPVGRVAWDRTLLSYMARVRVNLYDKYLITLTGRADGSSVFASDNKWGVFPSAAFGWKAHLEPWMQDLDYINEFKIRASYGSIGNEAISPYQTLGLASEANYIFGGVTAGGYQAGSGLFNPNLRWESSTTFNIGLDFGLFNNFLVGSFEFYNTETTDLLVDRTTPGGTGYNSIISNIGKVRNRGIELLLTSNLVRKNNLSWSVTAAFSQNRNEILDLFGELDDDGNPIDDIDRRRFIGHPINVIFQFLYDGIWQTEDAIADSHMPDSEPGRIRVQDVNGDNRIDIEDQVIINADPDWYGTLSTNFQLGGLELYAELYTVQGAQRSNGFLADYNSGGTLQGVLNGIKVDYWLPENPTGTFPRPRRSQADPFIWSAAVQDASYVRLRTLQLAYHFPGKWLDKLGLPNLTIYGTATNLFTWTDYLSYSPEVNINGYPDGKSFVFGLKIN
jgi:TonB-linked SusC/RagA family outer membrane protein